MARQYSEIISNAVQDIEAACDMIERAVGDIDSTFLCRGIEYPKCTDAILAHLETIRGLLDIRKGGQ